MDFKKYLGVFMKLFLDDLSVFSDLKTNLVKPRLCLINVENLVLASTRKMYVFGVFWCHTWLHYV
jgi:hypothetical protein